MRANDNNGTARRWGCAGVIVLYTLAAAGLVWLVAALSGCTTTKYVPVETVRTEYKDRAVEKLVTDTVRDTRVVWIKGDTVVDVRVAEKIKRVEIHDTCYIERVDTIRAPYPVERELTKWERAKMDLGGIAVGGVAIALCAAIIWLIRKFRR